MQAVAAEDLLLIKLLALVESVVVATAVHQLMLQDLQAALTQAAVAAEEETLPWEQQVELVVLAL
jgi:hypothetical protein